MVPNQGPQPQRQHPARHLGSFCQFHPTTSTYARRSFNPFPHPPGFFSPAPSPPPAGSAGPFPLSTLSALVNQFSSASKCTGTLGSSALPFSKKPLTCTSGYDVCSDFTNSRKLTYDPIPASLMGIRLNRFPTIA